MCRSARRWKKHDLETDATCLLRERKKHDLETELVNGKAVYRRTLIQRPITDSKGNVQPNLQLSCWYSINRYCIAQMLKYLISRNRKCRPTFRIC